MWQNHVLAAVQWLFSLALLPTLLHKFHKPSLFTCVLTTLLMAAVSGTYFSLGWLHSGSAASVLMLLWFVLTCQRYYLNLKSL